MAISSTSSTRGTAYISKRRFAEIKCLLDAELEDTALTSRVLAGIQHILNFDPQVSTYTAEHGRRVSEQRKKVQQETGQSLYVIAGVQRSYQRKKGSAAAADDRRVIFNNSDIMEQPT